MKSKPAGTDQRVQLADAESTHHGLHGQHPPRREDPGQQFAVQIVQRGIFEEQNARWHFNIGEQDVGGGPATDRRLPWASGPSSNRLSA